MFRGALLEVGAHLPSEGLAEAGRAADETPEPAEVVRKTAMPGTGFEWVAPPHSRQPTLLSLRQQQAPVRCGPSRGKMEYRYSSQIHSPATCVPFTDGFHIVF